MHLVTNHFPCKEVHTFDIEIHSVFCIVDIVMSGARERAGEVTNSGGHTMVTMARSPTAPGAGPGHPTSPCPRHLREEGEKKGEAASLL